MFSTSYTKEGHQLLYSLILYKRPNVVLELGTQQGGSALTIGRALRDLNRADKGLRRLYTYDLFQPQYALPPYGPTHSNKEDATANIKKHHLSKVVQIKQGSIFEAKTNGHLEQADIIHIDICNCYENIRDLFLNSQVKKEDIVNSKALIIFEGGVNNHWQKEIGTSSFTYLLRNGAIDPMFKRECLILSYDNNRAITLWGIKYVH